MALLTPLHQAGLDEIRPRARGHGYVVNAVAVHAGGNGLARDAGRRRLLPLVEFQRHTVKILEVGIDHAGVEPVFLHELRAAVASAAYLRDLLAVVLRPGVQNGVRRMAVHADGNIGISFVHEGIAVDARYIGVVDVRMTPFTPAGALHSVHPRLGDRMRAVAVRTDRRLEVALAEHGVVDALQGLRVLVEVTAPARLGVGDGEIARGLEVPLRVLVRGKTEMAVEAAQFGVTEESSAAGSTASDTFSPLFMVLVRPCR